MNPIEIQSSTRIRIGSHVYRCFFEQDQKPGFHVYTVETHGRPDGDYPQKFHIDDLRDLFASDLPESFSLSVYAPHLRIKCIDGLWVQKHEGRSELSLSFLHNFTDWHFSQNLHHFYHELRIALLKDPPYPLEVSIEKDEYGLSAWVKSSITNQEDINTHVFKVAAYIEKNIEEQTMVFASKSMRQEAVGNSAKLKPDEDGWKWWVRYVVVPLGVVTVAALLAFAFKSMA